MYAKIENGLAVEYPVYEGQLEERHPDRTYPLDTSGDPIPEGYVKVTTGTIPDPVADNYQYRYELGLPVLQGEVWVETYTKIALTDEEKTNQTGLLSYNLRKQRNKLLDESDKKVLADIWENYSTQEKTEWADYRQQLRDIPQTEGYPYNIQWPVEPSVFTVNLV